MYSVCLFRVYQIEHFVLVIVRTAYPPADHNRLISAGHSQKMHHRIWKDSPRRV